MMTLRVTHRPSGDVCIPSRSVGTIKEYSNTLAIVWSFNAMFDQNNASADTSGVIVERTLVLADSSNRVVETNFAMVESCKAVVVTTIAIVDTNNVTVVAGIADVDKTIALDDSNSA